MNKKQVFDLITGEKYYSIEDLRYNNKIGIMLSKEQFAQFLETKDRFVDEKCDFINSLPLKTFNSKHIFYVNSEYLSKIQAEYQRILVSDYELNQSWLFDRNVEDILISRLFSEVEGTLNIENVPTTHRRIIEINKSETLTEKNDIIIKNMINALKFIIENNPDFNKDNLRKLYQILSKDCLPNELQLKNGAYYRDDRVYIGEFEGADYTVIGDCMDSMFSFANDPVNVKKYDYLLSYICHYYILYVHPYFDYNGRTARMVSFWLNRIHKIKYAPYFMSEAINESKSGYYKAIVETRNTNNDLSCFLGYILETSVKYSFVYKNLEEIKKELSKTGDSLTSTEWVYVKKILVHNPENFFNYKMFLSYTNTNMTRQGALKILNNLCNYKILEKGKNKKGDVIFTFSKDFITYKYND